MDGKNQNPQQPDELFDEFMQKNQEATSEDMPQLELDDFFSEEPSADMLFADEILPEAPAVEEDPFEALLHPQTTVFPTEPEVVSDMSPAENVPADSDPFDTFLAPETPEISIEPEHTQTIYPPEDVFETVPKEEIPLDSFFVPDAGTPEIPDEAANIASDSVPEDGPIFIMDNLENIAYGDSATEQLQEAYTEAPLQSAFDDEGEFAEIFEAGTAEEEASAAKRSSRPRTARKGRPQRKKGYGLLGIPHLLATAIWLILIVVIGVSLGRMLWVCAADVLAFGRQDKSVSITVEADDTIDDIAEKLHKAGLIRYPGLFKLYAGFAVDEGEISTGTFKLNTLYDYHALVGGMSSSSSYRSVVEDVLIPEGYNCRQIFELLEEKGICTVAELEEYAANGEFSDFWFLEGVERGDKYCLEGYLFPDTYDFYAGSTPREALGKMLLGFEARFTEDLYNQLPALNERLSTMMRSKGLSEEYIAEHQFGVYELLIVASLIEEETSSAAESANIASVIYNRLTSKNEWERYLGIDATILYALGEHKGELTADDLSIDSPYNTRTHAGLTPTPITNPGLDSIKAALDPADTSYYYYVLNPDTGKHQFSKTQEEHDRWKETFKNAGETE